MRTVSGVVCTTVSVTLNECFDENCVWGGLYHSQCYTE